MAEQITVRFKRLYSDAAIRARQYGNETPLFLLPDGFGDISYAFELAYDHPVYVLLRPSPENGHPSSIEEIAEAMIHHIKKVRSNGPYAIAGYTVSDGILAFEIAKQLINSGRSVSF